VLGGGRAEPGAAADPGTADLGTDAGRRAGFARVGHDQLVRRDFSIRLALPAGTYTAEVTLVGRSNEAITVTKPLDAIDVVPGTDLAISVDFPSSSMI